MCGHIIRDVSTTNPRQSGFKIVLTDWWAFDEFVSKFESDTVSLGEFSFCVRKPSTDVVDIEKFLVGEFFSSDVDGTEPFEPLAFITVTDIDHKFVVEYSVLLVIGEIMESLFYTFAELHREVSFNKFAYRKRSLLTVE